MSWHAVAWADGIRIGDPLAKLLLLVLANYADLKHDTAWPSIDTLADKAEMSRATVIRKIALLEERGLIQKTHRTREDGGQTSNHYRLQIQALGVPHGDPPLAQRDPTGLTGRPKPITEPINNPPPTRARAKTWAFEQGDKPEPVAPDWQPAPETRAALLAEHRSLTPEEVADEAAAFRDYYQATGRAYLSWDHAFRRWVRRTIADRRAGRAGPRPTRAQSLTAENDRRANDALARLAQIRANAANGHGSWPDPA